MPDPSGLANGAIPKAEEQSLDAVVNEDAAAPGDEVKCVVPSAAAHLTTDPLPWQPYVTGAGVFYPKRGDRAIVTLPVGGPRVITAWWPAEGASPDVSF